MRLSLQPACVAPIRETPKPPGCMAFRATPRTVPHKVDTGALVTHLLPALYSHSSPGTQSSHITKYCDPLWVVLYLSAALRAHKAPPLEACIPVGRESRIVSIFQMGNILFREGKQCWTPHTQQEHRVCLMPDESSYFP